MSETCSECGDATCDCASTPCPRCGQPAMWKLCSACIMGQAHVMVIEPITYDPSDGSAKGVRG